MTNQEIFDTVAQHLLTQNSRAIDTGGLCSYRAPDGKKCAVGILIPDNSYKPHFEGFSVSALISHNLLPDFSTEQSTLLFSLQRIHDTAQVDTWRERLQAVAENYNLNSKVLSNES